MKDIKEVAILVNPSFSPRTASEEEEIATLAFLLMKTPKEKLREVLKQLPIHNVICISQAAHGRMYGILQGKK